MDEAKSFQSNLLQAFRNYSLQIIIVKSITLTFAAIAIYFQDLSIIFSDGFQNEAASHILLIPILITYLIYRKRKVLVATIQNEENTQENTKHMSMLAGFLLCLTALMVYIYGSQTFTPLQYHVITLPFFTAGLTLIMFNPRTLRQLLFPISFTTFLIPPPSAILNNVGSMLSVASTEAANAIVNLTGLKSWISTEIGTPIINIICPGNQLLSFAVDIACSGIHSLIGFLVFAAFIAYIVRDKTWKKLVIFAIGFPLIYLLNVIRITVTVLIGYQWGPHLALDIFHLIGGWVLVFLGTLILLVILEKAFKIQIFTNKTANISSNNLASQLKSQQHLGSYRNILKSKMKFRTADATKITALILLTMFIIYIQSPVFALAQGPAPILVQTPEGQQGNVLLFPQLCNYTLNFVYRDTEFEELSRQDFSLAYEYLPQKEGDSKVNVLLEVAETTTPLHPWESCLVEWRIKTGYKPVTVLDLRDISLHEDPPVIARYFAFYTNNRIQLVLYWFENAVFNINNVLQQKFVKISLVTYFDNPEDLSMKEDQLLPFAEAILGYWKPVKTWNIITMFLSQNSLYLAYATLSLLIVLLILHSIQTRRKRKANAITYQKLSKQNKQIIDAIRKTEKTTPTLENIARTYKKITGQVIKKDQLLKSLIELEKTGIIKNQIINMQDVPIQIWKTQI